MRLPLILLLIGLAFIAGLRTQAMLEPAQAAAAAGPQVYHISSTDKFPALAPGISGKLLGHVPQGDVEVIEITSVAAHTHQNIDELAYVISGRGHGMIGKTKYQYAPGDVIYLPRNVPHSLFSDGKMPIRLLGIAYPKDIPTDMKMVK